MGGGQEQEAHALFLGRIDFFRDRGHVLALAPVDDGRGRTLADRRAGAVDGGVAAADDDDPLTEIRPLIVGLAFEEMQRAEDASLIVAGDADLRFLPGAERQEHRVELVFQVAQRDIGTDTRI